MSTPAYLRIPQWAQSWFAGAAVLLAGLCFAADALAQADGKPDVAKSSVQDAVAEAKKTGKPLIVLGTSETCSRCQALKQGLSSNPDLKLLLTQYITVDVPFAGREFKEAFHAIIARDKKFNQPIGSPSVFLFTAAGDPVYAGPNQPSGMAAGDELKKLLIEGIGKKRRRAKLGARIRYQVICRASCRPEAGTQAAGREASGARGDPRRPAHSTRCRLR